jgi:hypothetical protein
LIVSDKKSVLDGIKQDKQVKQQAVFNAQEALDEAQRQYETALIPDPIWIHPTYQQEHTRQVPKTEMVARVISVPRTTTTLIPGGLTATTYNRQGYDNAPPMPYAGEQPLSSQNVSQINFNWGEGLVLNSGRAEDVIVKFQGSIMPPVSAYYRFYAPADDGVRMYIGNTFLIDDWYDKGGGGTVSGNIYLQAGALYPITLYYYENGGGASVSLYSYTSTDGYRIVPASWFGEQTVTETTYENQTVYEEVTTIVNETYYTTELVQGATAPMVNDPALLLVVNDRQATLYTKQEDLGLVSEEEVESTQNYEESLNLQSEKAGIIVIASNDVTNKQENVYIAQQELETIPPFREPTPTPEKTQEPTEEPEIPVSPEIPEPNTPTPTETPKLPVVENPQSLTPTQVEELRAVANEILNNSEPGSKEYQEALVALFVAAQADDIVLDPALAAVPGLSAAVDALNFVGNVGSDMSPKVREQSEKIVVAAVVAVGAAVQAATGAAVSAAATRKVN